MSVVSAAHGVLGPLLGKLADLLAGKFGRVRGVRKDILSLQAELTSMHAALQEYTMLEDPGVQVKAWISLLRELAYDTEDCIDKFIRHLGKHGRRGGFKEIFRDTTRFLRTLDSRCGIADQIEELKARIKHVKELKDSYKLSETSCTKTEHAAVDPRLCALFAEEAHLVGVKGPRDDLVKWMLTEETNSSTKDRKVLSIVGFGGLGKTTLANEVYRKIERHFDCQAFVSVSQKPVIKKIIKDLIYKVPCPDEFRKDIEIWDEATSIAKLRELLKDKRYLVIVDDIWSTQAWSNIKCAFPDNNCSSRIITTTRIIDVARSCCPGSDDRVYEMAALSDLHSKRLFLKRIFGSEDHCPDMLKESSNEILKKCGGLPLAIVSISSLLANRPAVKEEWEKIRRSIGSALENNQSLEGMSKILLLSYNDLPPNLKTCLLYLSVFPEDYVIDRKRLVRRWIAEGFISEERGQSRQEVAERYFYELVNKSMVQLVDVGYDGKARACRVHDMMLELIISKSNEDNFIVVVGGGQTTLGNRQGFIRRLSIQHIDHEIAHLLAQKDLSHVRSLTVTSSACIKHLPSLGKFEALRVLDFEGCSGLEEYDMKSIGKLLQLKYLNFRDTGISKLPSGIVMLRDLETLDFGYTGVKELPTGFVQLTKLQHVIAGSRTTIPNRIGNMRNLQEISGFSITQSPADAVEDLGNLPGLEEIDVDLDGGESDEFRRHEEMLLSSLCKLGSCKLRFLQITRHCGGSLEFLESWTQPPVSLQVLYMYSSNYYFTKLPKWIAPALTSLSFLEINLAELTEEGLVTLGELPALLRLDLWFKKRPDDRVTVRGFPSLRQFTLYSNYVSPYVTFVKGSMPKLKNLDFLINVSVAKTYGFYLGIEHLTCLQQATARLDNRGVTPSERKAAEAAVRAEAVAHPNHPTITICCTEKENEETGGEKKESREDVDTDEN
ncbi:disease resistance protein RGA5-like [Triticum dicoccoides]|uniref:disease resistance protein RGA5-like n=1 Tax=Triticum dicoccoides TaxID=85692 RepID=UPI000E79F687|nr:disease resistance protein RGA5-like [Triticum dicoccoides]XP_037444591.1 disease resistance protein RGA5-like [Triticum dicoccoides]